MHDDGFWKDVEDAYCACVREGFKASSHVIWEVAKERARHKYVVKIAAKKAELQRRPFEEVMYEELMSRKRDFEFH